MAFQSVLLEQSEPGIYLRTVKRRLVLNALNAATLDEFARAIARVAADAATRVLRVPRHASIVVRRPQPVSGRDSSAPASRNSVSPLRTTGCKRRVGENPML
jgi:hypothetical protein